MQIPYSIRTSLSEYQQLVNERKWKFPDFSDNCPICGGKNCPVRIGYYYRYCVDLLSGQVLLIAVARFMCKRKGKPKIKDLTFSLLPHVLIPYLRYTIATAMVLCGEILQNEKSKEQVTDEVVFAFEPDDQINFEERYICHFLNLFEQTILKLRGFLSSLNQDVVFLNGREGLKAGWQYLNNFSDDSGLYTGATGFSLFIYEKLGGYARNPQFLFGTAYQFL
jgi:hypothetical protein